MAKKNSYLDLIRAAQNAAPKAATVAAPVGSNVVSLIVPKAAPAPDVFLERCKNAGISPTGAIAQCMAAYSDCNGTEGNRERSLQFLCSTAFDGPGLRHVVGMSCPEGYNAFNEHAVNALIQVFGEDGRYYFGREGSVVIYAIPSVKALARGIPLDGRLRSAYPDELSLQADGRFRLWWD